MMNLTKKYWFYISKNVYVSFNKKSEMLLYNTNNGDYIETNNLLCIELVNEVYKPANLGVIFLKSEYTKNQQCLVFIDKVIEKKIGAIIELKTDTPKPINLLPILNLQKDIDKLKKNGEYNLIGEGLIDYLTEVNIYINSICKQKCKLCKMYYRQCKSCYKTNTEDFLPPNTIENILLQVTNSKTKIINILGGDIFLYPYWSEINNILKKFDYEYHLWSNYLNLTFELSKFIDISYFNEILITFPLNQKRINKIIEFYKHFSNFQLHFLIENTSHYKIAKKIITNFNNLKYRIIPIFNGNNISFFEDNIYLKKEDIFSKTISMRKIFCNQKINSNYFGVLNILPDGAVKANINKETLGNINVDSLLKIIYKEIIEKSSWRKTRSNDICNSCLFQFLCPPPSNYELILRKDNLCHLQ